MAGMRVAVYQQSSVARDLLPGLLAALGAEAVPLGRSPEFVPLDTEAHRPEDVAFAMSAMASGRYDAMVTTDGDADRPLVADASGRILRGDVLGMLTARFLGVRSVVVPVTAGSGVERAGGFERVVRTKVGSPFVIEGMAEAVRGGSPSVAGFESNGGFLLGTDADAGAGRIGALPTRDAVLPILAALAAARRAGTGLSELVADLDAGETASDRIADVPSAHSARLLARLAEVDFRSAFLRPVGEALSVDLRDGVRIGLDGDRTIHFRASGNAPELRCYAEAGTSGEAVSLVRWGLREAADFIMQAAVAHLRHGRSE